MTGPAVVKWQPGWKQGDFLGAVVKAGGFAPGAIVELEYQHDDGCPKLTGGPCRCDPDVAAYISPAPKAA